MTGRIVDARTQAAVQSAVVQVGIRITRLSPADNGGFTLDHVPTGTQPVSITSPGFVTYNGSVVVHKDQESPLNIIGLAPAGP